MHDGDQGDIKTLVEEIFISPIRSVLLVDDEYPTLDLMLSGFINKKAAWRKWNKSKAKATESAKRVSNILKYSRSKDRNWLVDVHDGKNVDFRAEASSVEHLHQSDLLFLDFHLDGDSASPEKCIKILKHLADSNHFNLVVLVTKEVLSDAFEQILPEFVTGKFADNLSVDEAGVVSDILEEWGDEDSDIMQKLEECLSLSTYIEISQISSTSINTQDRRIQPFLTSFLNIIGTKPEGLELDENLLLKWVLVKTEENLNLGGAFHLEHSPLGGDRHWLCYRNLFLAFYRKNSGVVEAEASEIVDTLTTALIDWKPTANRIILSKFRAEMESGGLAIGDNIFTERHMQAKWLSEMIEASDDERLANVDTAIARYGDALTKHVSGPIRDAVSRSLDYEVQADITKRTKLAFDVVLSTSKAKKRAILEHNHVVSCGKISGWHLQPGHIFEFKDNLWVCLTPACDLVPNRDKSRSRHLGELMPLKAVKLTPISERVALQKATQNLCLYLGESPNFSYYHFTVDGSSTSEVHWNEFLAKNQGKIRANEHEVMITTTQFNEQGRFELHWRRAKIVAHLRYEYAINLMQVLGSRTSRVGLDFVN